MLFCLASGDFDFRLHRHRLCWCYHRQVINMSGSLWLGVFAGLMLGVVSGFINGFVIARLKINALITTLATMQIVRGLAYIISDGKAVGIKESFFTLVMPTGWGACANLADCRLPYRVWLPVKQNDVRSKHAGHWRQ
jgi:L-arabinose transport system permease protein